jgi:hypothetical protein
MHYIFFLFLILLIYIPDSFSQNHKIISSDQNSIKIEFDFSNSYEFSNILLEGKNFLRIIGSGINFREPGQPWLPEYIVNIGIPFDATPELRVLNSDQSSQNNIMIPPYPKEDPQFVKMDLEEINKEIYYTNNYFPGLISEFGSEFVFRYARILPVKVSPFQYNPITRELLINRKVIVEILYNSPVPNLKPGISDQFTFDYLNSTVLNYQVAQNWLKSKDNSVAMVEQSWYNPAKDYFKIYLKDKGVYRLTYESLVNSGVPLGGGVASEKLEIFNNGISIPIDVIDGGDLVFGPGDYLQFIGGAAIPTPYTSINIYNNSNVYWLSYQSDSTGINYQTINGYPTSYQNTYQSVPKTLHFEQDSLYERLGYAGNDLRDFWFWGKASAQFFQINSIFKVFFDGFEHLNFDSAVTLTVDLHGMTSISSCNPDHKAYIDITDQPIGDITWDGQSAARFQKKFYVGEDSIHIYPTGNFLKVTTLGDACGVGNDEIRINWFQMEYQKYNRSNGNNFDFIAPERYSGINRFWITNWSSDKMTIYIPSKNKKILYPQFLNDIYKSVLFVDTVSSETEYFCVDNYYLTPDSIKRDIQSDLRNPSNGADYIIITHKKFISIADQLKAFRENDFPDTTIQNARIKITLIDDIYDEFAYGLLDPFAIQKFLKYAFENWEAPAPSYVVLIGDMSHDYRQIVSSSRENFIPSIPYYTNTYGLAASDNMFAAVVGNDVVPDMVISRISIETVEEGNIFLDKVINYPSDNSKPWKQNVLLISSGLNEEDENYFGFNNASVKLENLYLTPNGFKSTKIMRYPNQPQYTQFQGGGPEIRKAINDGTIFVNYYGHGGGYQWDLTFLSDDIFLLENGGRLPFISSVTCYTAHFDNQDVFGEQFIKVPGKGAIAFFGSSGLTLWGIGNYINELLFREIYTDRVYITGKAILNAKSLVGGSGFYNSQIALLTLLGEPLLKLALPDKPDFALKTGDLTLTPENPLAGDTIIVKLKLLNLGVVFPNDSVNVEIIASSPDTTYIISQSKIGSFGETDSLSIPWIPQYGGLYNFTVNVNLTDPIPEMDFTDNSINVSHVVFDLSEPSVIDPIDGLKTVGAVDFLISDIGHYLDLSLEYFIEIDTSLSFITPLLSQKILPVDGELRWKSPILSNGKYFWRTRIFDGERFGGYSKSRAFTISDTTQKGYHAAGNILNMFNTYNINYSYEDESLVLNTDLLPPKPSVKRFIGDIDIDIELLDSISLTTITSDGKYIYLATIKYWALDPLNEEGASQIYKIGSGYNGTIEGEFYGVVPNFYHPIRNQMFYHSDGFIYVADGQPFSLLRVNPESGDTLRIQIPSGLMNSDNSKIEEGPQYITSDGNYIYNLAISDTSGNNRYTLRVLDPSNGWNMARPDMQLSSSSYYLGFTGFFVAKNYLFPSEYYWYNEMRRIRIEDGVYEEEWISFIPFQSYYAWHYDWINNVVYSTVFRPSGYEPKLSKFQGNYVDAAGNISSSLIGPASEWNTASYQIENQSSSSFFNVTLLGFNENTRALDTLNSQMPSFLDLESIDSKQYPYLRMDIELVDSSLGASSQIRLKEIEVDYETLPEVIFTKPLFIVNPDTTLQGFDIKMDFKAKNIGKIRAENLSVEFYLDDEDSSFFVQNISIDPDSSVPVESQILSTYALSPATLHKIKAVGKQESKEYFTFNNILRKGFYVARDSIKPLFTITVDGKEIINGDVVSSNPDIIITLKDSGPLQLDTSLITVVYNNIPLNFTRPDVEIKQTSYPENTLQLRWNPELPDGRHVLEVLGKDPSGNFFDSVAHRTVFYIFNHFDLVEVYNYPNPFSSETYFTFQLYGDNAKLEEFKIKVYSVAGRLIRDFDVPLAALRSGFNKIYWDGRDEDGDEVANGVYFYKVITKSDGEVRTKIQKLAKVK